MCLLNQNQSQILCVCVCVKSTFGFDPGAAPACLAKQIQCKDLGCSSYHFTFFGVKLLVQAACVHHPWWQLQAQLAIVNTDSFSLSLPLIAFNML